MRRAEWCRRLGISASIVGAGIGAQAQVVQPGIPADPRVRYDGDMVVRVDVRTPREQMIALGLSKDVWTCGGAGLGQFDIQVSPEQRAALTQAGIRHSVFIPDVQALIDAEWAHLHQGGGPAAGWFDDFKDYNAINAYTQQLVATYPNLAKYVVLGKTLQGNDIFGIRITGPGDPSQRGQVLYIGCQHAREWVSPMTCMYIADQLLAKYGSDAKVKKALDSLEFIIVPVVNGDGYKFTWTDNRMWRKNRRDNAGSNCDGVDTNRNWGYQWGGEGASSDPCNDTYRGASAFSEPETQVLRDFTIANPRIIAAVDWHCYSQLVMSPWGYTAALPPDDAYFQSVSAKMAAAIKAVHNMTYTYGTVYNHLYPASGVSIDWWYGARDIGAWTIELRDTGQFGFILPADQIIPTGEENFAAVMVMADEYGSALKFALPDGVPGVVEPNTPTPITVSISNGTGVYQTGSGKLYARIGNGAYSASALTSLGGNLYEGTLTGAPCGSSLDFYFEASTTGGQVVQFPDGGAGDPFSTEALEVNIAFDDNAETNKGWTVGAPGDNATAGKWNRMDPQATTAQPEDDHTAPPGVACWITDGNKGNQPGDFDVDNGTTSLISPKLDGTGGGQPDPDPTISYWRWYSNDKGGAPNSDSMPVQISNDDGQTWTQLELVTQNANAWVFKSFRVKDFVTPTNALRLRFQARDLGQGSLVEAGVDDISLTLTGCTQTCFADCDQSGTLDIDDFICFQTLFGLGDPGADCDQSGGLDIDDFICFQTAFGIGCP